MYLPGAVNGLLSVDALASKGANVEFLSASRVGLVKVNDKVILSTRPGSGYVLKAKLIRPVMSSDDAFHQVERASSTRMTSSAPLMVWHRRYGHIAPSTILNLAAKDSVRGLLLNDKQIDDCEACIMTKTTRSPFKAVSTPAPRTLHRVFMDLGFVDEKDEEARSVYLAIVDQHSTARWTFPLPSKQADEILPLFHEWRLSAEKLAGARLVHVRSDNGGEFVNAKFKKYFADHGILHETTAPYTPEQNGQVERLNGSLMALVKAMLQDSGLAKSFWSRALAVATYIGNRTPNARLEGKTPIEIVTGHKPSVGHLRPFGSVAFAHIDKSQRSKLDPSAKKGILVGYSGDYNYLVWFADDKRTITTRHATFGHQEEPQLDERVWLEEAEMAGNGQEHPQTPSPGSVTSASDEPRLSRSQSDFIGKDGWEYRETRVGRNPGRLENVNKDNIIEGARRRAHLVSAEPAAVYAHVAIVLDDDEPVKGVWEEESVFIGIAMPGVPKNYADAISSPHRLHWLRAMMDEWEAFEAHNVLMPCKLPLGAKALGTTWVYTTKTSSDGSTKYKARLVAQGFAQRPGIDVNETFAPVARTSTIRYIFALAAARDLKLEHFDFNTAFLNGRMTEDVYIKVPPSYPGKVGPADVLKLVGSMYGTEQAPREWHRALDALMTRQGYVKSSADVCVYIKTIKNQQIIAVIYVDDGLILAPSTELINSELDLLHKVYTLKRLGPVSNFLSIEVARSTAGILIHHSRYINSILERFGFVTPSRNRATTPMEERSSVSILSDPYEDIPLYQSAVGALMFTATYVRVDIAVAVRAAAQKVIAPTQADWLAVKRIFLYLANNPGLGIFYRAGASPSLIAFSDASWADDLENRRSIGAYVVLVADGVISWRSKQQTLVATSTTESEMIAASDTTKEVISLRKLCSELDSLPPGPTTIYEDNQACIAISQNPTSHGRTKHFDVAQLFVRERALMGEVRLEYISTDNQTADFLTKPLTRIEFEYHRNALGMRSLSATSSRGSVGGGS